MKIKYDAWSDIFINKWARSSPENPSLVRIGFINIIVGKRYLEGTQGGVSNGANAI